MSHKFPKFEHIVISGSHTGSTAFNVSIPQAEYFFSIDASSSIDGGSRVLIRNSNDFFETASLTRARGVLHIDEHTTSSQDLVASGISLYSYATGAVAAGPETVAKLSLHTWNDNYGNGSSISLASNQYSTFPYGWVNNNQLLGVMRFGGWDGNQTAYPALIRAAASCDWNYSAINGTRFEFFTCADDAGYSGGVTEKFRMTGYGQFIILGSASSEGNAMGNIFLSGNTDPSLQVFGGSKLGDMTSDTHQVTGSLHMSGAASILLNAPNTELADASMNSSTVTMHVDEGTNKLFFKVKYADGITVKSGSIDLA